MHLVWSPLVKSTEAAFLRNSAYFMCRKGQQASTHHIDQLLHTLKNDDWEIREIGCRGLLEEDAQQADNILNKLMTSIGTITLPKTTLGLRFTNGTTFTAEVCHHLLSLIALILRPTDLLLPHCMLFS